MPTTPAYAKAKTITSRTGAAHATKHRQTLARAQQILTAQGDPESRAAAVLIGITVDAYTRELRAYYVSEHNPYLSV